MATVYCSLLIPDVINDAISDVISHVQLRRQEFSFGGYSLGGLRDRSPPVGFKGEAPIGVSGTPEAETVGRYCLQILTTKRSKFENFAQFTSWFLTSMFHGGD